MNFINEKKLTKLYEIKGKPIKKCSFCGIEFEIEINKKYIVKSQESLLNISFFDAMDCPNCGCQNIIWKRLEKASVITEKTKK